MPLTLLREVKVTCVGGKSHKFLNISPPFPSLFALCYVVILAREHARFFFCLRCLHELFVHSECDFCCQKVWSRTFSVISSAYLSDLMSNNSCVGREGRILEMSCLIWNLSNLTCPHIIFAEGRKKRQKAEKKNADFKIILICPHISATLCNRSVSHGATAHNKNQQIFLPFKGSDFKFSKWFPVQQNWAPYCGLMDSSTRA